MANVFFKLQNAFGQMAKVYLSKLQNKRIEGARAQQKDVSVGEAWSKKVQALPPFRILVNTPSTLVILNSTQILKFATLEEGRKEGRNNKSAIPR